MRVFAVSFLFGRVLKRCISTLAQQFVLLTNSIASQFAQILTASIGKLSFNPPVSVVAPLCEVLQHTQCDRSRRSAQTRWLREAQH